MTMRGQIGYNACIMQVNLIVKSGVKVGRMKLQRKGPPPGLYGQWVGVKECIGSTDMEQKRKRKS